MEEERIIFQDHLIAKKVQRVFHYILIKNMPNNQEYKGFDSSEEDLVSSIIKKY